MSSRPLINLMIIIVTTAISPMLLGLYFQEKNDAQLNVVTSAAAVRPAIKLISPISSSYEDAFITIEASDKDGLDKINIIDESRQLGVSLYLAKAKPIHTFKDTFRIAEIFKEADNKPSQKIFITVKAGNTHRQETSATTEIKLK